MKLREMQRYIHAQVRLDPARQAAKLRIVVVKSGHHQVNDLGPLIHLSQSDQRVEHRFQLTGNNFAVIRLSECLQIDLDPFETSSSKPPSFLYAILRCLNTGTGCSAECGRS